MIERIAEERAGSVKVARVNVDEEPRLADAAGVRGIPFLVLYRDGAPVTHVVGAHPSTRSESALGSMLRQTGPHRCSQRTS